MEITNPSVSASLSDSSRNDDSFTQSETTINIGQGATYNQNCGNGRELTRRRSMWTMILCSVVCDAILVGMLFYMHRQDTERADAVGRTASAEIANAINEQTRVHDQMMKQAKEGTIWLLRDDIMKTIDFYDATLKITHKQFKRIKDEYEYYISIGGNHDVKERFEDFLAKIYGTGEIKMVPDDAAKH